MAALVDMSEDEVVDCGDVIRLAYNYDLGPGSPPVDLLVYDPLDAAVGPGLIVLSGYKSGLIYALLPLESRGARRGIRVGWLRARWDDWFSHLWRGEMLVVPMSPTSILRWQERELVPKHGS